MSWALGFLDIRDQHLDIAVATEPALPGHLADMTDFRTTEKSALDGLVLLAEFDKNRNDVVCFILHESVSCQSSVCCNSSLLCGPATLLQHFMKPRRHLLLMSMGPQFRALIMDLVYVQREIESWKQTPSRFAPSGPIILGGLRARSGLDELFLAKSRSAPRLPLFRDVERSSEASQSKEKS